MRANRDTRTFTFNVPDNRRAELAAEAERLGLTISDVIRLRLAQPTALPAADKAAEAA